jgi:two-component system sensor kinase FixL
MPAPHRDHHDVYISRYLETGESKVIGIGRQVEVLGKNGELIPAHLSIGEIKIGAGSLFTGVLRPTP